MPGELGKHVGDALGDAHTRLECTGSPPHPADLGAQGFGFVGAVVVVDRNVAACACELVRDGPADAARGAGDERDFSGQGAWHDSIPQAGQRAA